MNFYSLLDCLDEEIEKAPKELRTALKEVIGHIVVEMAVSGRSFIPILWAYHRAKKEEVRLCLSY